jgi:5-methyltetrahydrofolate--homocysteine methyltransferase
MINACVGERFKDFGKLLKNNSDILNLTQPDIIREVHQAYLDAGADIIETNTFNGQSISQEDFGLEHLVYEINKTAAKLARSAADKKTADMDDGIWRLVAGAVGPTNKTCSVSPKVEDPSFRNTSYMELKDSYKDQIRALVEGGSHIIFIETIFDSLNARAGIYAYKEYFEESGLPRPLPLFISGTIIDAAGRTLSG